MTEIVNIHIIIISVPINHMNMRIVSFNPFCNAIEIRLISKILRIQIEVALTH